MKARIASLLLDLSFVSEAVAAPEPDICGIGAVLTSGDGRGPRIRMVLPNSPAEKAKLIPDLIVSKIDTVPTAGRKLDQCVNQIRGEEGSIVELEVTDPTDGSSTSVYLKRERLDFA